MGRVYLNFSPKQTMDYVPQHGNAANLADRDNISGARVFDGEDQGYGNRLRMQQLQQADWIA